MNLQKMMKQAQEMQAKFTAMQEDLGKREIEGQAGGGLVKALVNGKGDLLRVTIDHKLMDAEEKEMLEDLIVAAFNNAKTQLDEAAADEMKKATSGLGLPPGFKLPF